MFSITKIGQKFVIWYLDSQEYNLIKYSKFHFHVYLLNIYFPQFLFFTIFLFLKNLEI